MFKKKYYYLVKIQYLGYRFHGWQKQPNLKTLHLMIDKTLRYVLKNKQFKTLVAGRTDAMVSANETALELFINENPLPDLDAFLIEFNYNLPQDIRAISIGEINKEFNIIQHSKRKEYIYLFSHGTKNHPFCASLMTTILDPLNVDMMKLGAACFVGSHNFKAYCYRAKENSKFIRTIEISEIVSNNMITASFFPKESFLFRVIAKGFGRNQVRLMMGVLIKLGRGEVNLKYIEDSLQPEFNDAMDYVAPASGLILNKIEFE